MRHRPIVDGRPTVSLGLERLLSRLDSDRDRAAAEYQRLRVTLEKFFDWHCAWPPEECADETLDRLASKLATEVEIVDVRAYARGIARLVLLEWRRRPAPVSMDERFGHAEPRVPPAADDYDGEAFHACFDRCLAALSVESHAIVLEYYGAERRAKIDNRRRLAQRLGISESALRNRVQRIRNRLEQCVQGCTATAAVIGLEAAVTRPLEVSSAHEE
jgi:DNA-directed RNA polymerase specialized sigma24 family protein